jgi:hypothetical protein
MKFKTFIIILTITVSITAIGCTKPDETKRILQQQGYSDIKITGYKFLKCSKYDQFHTGFSAVSPNGTEKKVEGRRIPEQLMGEIEKGGRRPPCSVNSLKP